MFFQRKIELLAFGHMKLFYIKFRYQTGLMNSLLQGSGRAADILAFAYQNSIGEEIDASDQEGKTKKM